MRIISGNLKGRTLVAPTGRVTRPTAAVARGALFEIVQNELDDARLADLFAGTGSLGLEALSRGARSVDFYENDRHARNALRTNIDALGVGKRCRVFPQALPETLVRGEPYDIILVDPPWREGHELRIARRIMAAGRLAADGLLVVENPRSEPLEQNLWDDLGLTLDDRRTYGDTELRFYRRPALPNALPSDMAFSPGEVSDAASGLGSTAPRLPSKRR